MLHVFRCVALLCVLSVLLTASSEAQRSPPPKLVDEIAAVDRRLMVIDRQLRQRSETQEANALLVLGRTLAARVELEIKLQAAVGSSNIHDVPSVTRFAGEAARTLTRLARRRAFAANEEVMSLLGEQHRVLGAFAEMTRVWRRLIARHPCSPRAVKASLTLGDHRFDRAGSGLPGTTTAAELTAARQLYEGVVQCKRASAESIDFARFKLAWIAVNTSDWQTALTLFEQVAIRATSKLRGEALSGLVVCLTEVKPLQPLTYLQRFKLAAAERLRVYQRLASSLTVKQRHTEALPVWRLALATATDIRRTDLVEQITQQIQFAEEALKQP